ncbi:MAG: BON domain-containing protein [Planctomycetota bacterium]|nr:MAG: BON domain-containing protein [Planctomycetota bacterium]
MASVPYDEETVVRTELPPVETPRRPTRAERDRLAGDIAKAILRETGGCVRHLHVEINRDGIVISGRCPTYYMKQRAQHAAMALAPGKLDNEIEVG